MRLGSPITGMRWAGTAALAVALAAGLGVTVAPAAQASGGHAVAVRSYSSWRKAQRAAHFTLLRPTRTFGMHRSGRIVVEKCQFAPHVVRETAAVNYRGSADRQISILEAGYKTTCGNMGEARVLGHYRINGSRATLLGSCNLPDTPPCSHRKKELYLVWVRHGKNYQVSYFAFRRRSTVSFARAMRPVR
jgi:hypothetical protein